MAEIDKVVGANVARLRGEISQADLATRMTDDHKIKWSQTTVWEVEKGRRALKFSEAIALAEILEVPLYGLVSYPDGLAELHEGAKHYEKRNAAVQAILENMRMFDIAKSELRSIASRIKNLNTYEDSEGLQEQAEKFLKLGSATLTAVMKEISDSEKKRVEHWASSEEHLAKKYITPNWETHGIE
ncbi:helix-turn-helix domain-containing protein [Glutamicibacter sp. AGC46]